MFKKLFFFVFFLLILTFNFCFFIPCFGLDFYYFESYVGSFFLANFHFFVSFLGFFFTLMLFSVMLLVLLYSEFYLENYNVKKFFYSFLLFCFSMVMLVWSNGGLLLMISWDFLGISSLCLIMFYPSKTGLFNSFLTMVFNRLGDVLLVVSLAVFILLESSDSLLLISNSVFLILIILCAFTKSAQFPFSSWLPAAMSAPTPISALVHSSTLVTAGIFLLCLLYPHLISMKILDMILVFSLGTFLMGGFMAFLELDIKKVVAFSTLSQISMIIYFLGLSLFALALLHMIFHALFKSLLFVSVGFIFGVYFMDQNFSSLGALNYIIKFYVLFTIFLMTGLIYSSSFFSKDAVLESQISDSFNFLVFLTLMGAFLTFFYSLKISLMLKKSIIFSGQDDRKLFHKFLFIFLFMSLGMNFFTPLEVSYYNFFFQTDIYLIMFFVFFLSLIFSKEKFLFDNMASEISLNIFFMKFWFFSMFQSLLSFEVPKLMSFSDLRILNMNSMGELISSWSNRSFYLFAYFTFIIFFY